MCMCVLDAYNVSTNQNYYSCILLPFSHITHCIPFLHTVMLLSFIIRNSICLNITEVSEGLLDVMSSHFVLKEAAEMAYYKITWASGICLNNVVVP